MNSSDELDSEKERVNLSVRKPGSMLIARLYKKAQQLDMSRTELADALGVSYVYLNKLSSSAGRKKDIRSAVGVSDEFIDKAVEFLNLPKVVGLMMAQKLKAEDFRCEDDLADDLRRALDFISNDKQWGYLVTENVLEAAQDVKLLIVKLYEDSSGLKVLKDIDLSPVLESVESFYSPD